MLEDPVILNQYLTDVGDGTGVSNAIGDYDATPTTFFIQPADGEVMIINRLLIHLSAAGGFLINFYGGAPALTNGIDIKVTDNRSSNESVIPEVIKTNNDLRHVGSEDFSLVTFSFVDSIVALINFKEMGLPIKLIGSKGHKIEIPLSDSFVVQSDHHFIAQGYK